jgi:hypothetical protein
MTAMVALTTIRCTVVAVFSVYLCFSENTIFHFEMRNRNIFKNILDISGAIIKIKHLPEKASLENPFRADIVTIERIKSSSFGLRVNGIKRLRCRDLTHSNFGRLNFTVPYSYIHPLLNSLQGGDKRDYSGILSKFW